VADETADLIAELTDAATPVPLLLGVAEATDPVDDSLPVDAAALVELPPAPVEHVTASGRFVTPAIPQKFRAKEVAVF
jgi:hypothetical protein